VVIFLWLPCMIVKGA